MLGVVDLDLDGDVDLDLDADLDADVDGGPESGADGGPGLLTGWWHALGLGAMPITVAVSLIVAFGWFVALVATGLANELDVAAVVRFLAGLAVLVLAFAAGALGAAVAGRPLSRLFTSTHAERRSDFVGRTCIIRTERVTAEFGQAEAADPSGATVLLPVRPLPGPAGHRPSAASAAEATSSGTATASPADVERDLHYGATALIVHYDREAEVFLVAPLDEDLGTP